MLILSADLNVVLAVLYFFTYEKSKVFEKHFETIL